MSGGLIQLVAYGIEDIFLTRDPQITFFKVVYRRHTNFSTEPVKQFFVNDPDFGRKSTCIVGRNGDLIGNSILVVTLPQVRNFTSETGTTVDQLTKFAWVKKIGYAIIDTIEIEIGGSLIDRHYGEWLNIWSELTYRQTNEGYNKMIGNIAELTDYSNGKDTFTLYIPLAFWFCRTSGLALPVIALQYSDVKINVLFSDLDKCVLVTPTNYINIENDVVNFKDFEYIEQNVDGVISAGIFAKYDDLTKRLYYTQITRQPFQTMTVANLDALSPEARRQLVYSAKNTKYLIRGLESGAAAMPEFNSNPQTHSFNENILSELAIVEAYLLIEYIYLDEEERIKFVDTRHDYIIEQLIQINSQTVESPNRKLHMNLIQPCKLLVWVVQYDYLTDTNNNDWFNYTDSYKYKDGKQVGKSLVLNETILLNGHERLSFRNYNYFNYTQPYQNFPYAPTEGINVYALGMFPSNPAPCGTCNMSQIDVTDVQLSMSKDINLNNVAKFRGYSLGYNIYRIINGLGGIVFTR